MATRSGNLAAGKALAGRGGGNGGRYGLKATVAAGIATLGCVAALVFGGGWATRSAPVQPQAAPATAQALAGTDDLAPTGCVGTAGPFACQTGQSLAGTDDLATTGCIGTTGPFACATVRLTATFGTDDLATNRCIGTVGPFACPATPTTQER